MLPSPGSKWMSEAPSSIAWAMIWLTSLMTGASSAVSRRSTTSACSSGPSSAVGDDLVEAGRPLDEREDVVARGDDRPHLVARS